VTGAAPEWSRVETELDAALDRDSADRAAFLADLRRRDPAVAASVDRLLRAIDAGPSLLDRALPEIAPDLVVGCLEPGESAAPPVEAVGPYRLLREIGRGGMGEVYLAERSDGQYQKQVAVKLVRPGVDRAGLERRFERERQILATLEHPNIARLIDGGVTDAGLPYLVLEYVEGSRIDEYCERKALGPLGRLDLFDRVAGAVEFAHQKLVVHRDLKPGNILVSDAGEVKLLDFGIAKLLDEDPAVGGVTRTGALLATPEYASPEQVRGEPVSAATDVYALGVILYELLSGRRPYRATSATPHDLAVAICEELPPRPGLGGDLDAIVLMALAKEPAHRYGSVQQLRDDLERYRRGFPVRARPATRRYRAGKFLRRNRGKLVATTLVTGAVVAGLAATTWQARSAQREARRAERVVAFLSGIFQVSDPDRSGGGEVTARQLLDRGAAQLDRELGTEPALRADMLRTIGVLYQRLGHYPQARALIERSGTVLDSIGAGPLDRATQAAALVSVLHDLGDDAAAEVRAREVLEVRRRSLGESDPQVSKSLSDLAVVLARRGAYDEADSLYRRALALERRRSDDSSAATTLNNLALVHQARGRTAEARRLQEEALALDRQRFGEEHTRVATDLQNLASTLTMEGAYDSAEALLTRAIRVRERLLGPDHPLVATALGALANTYGEHGRLDSAASLNRRVLELRERALGARHPLVAESYNNLAVTEYRRARFDLAATAIGRALEIWRPALGDTHPTFLTALNNLGAIKRAGGDLAGAEPVLREVLALRRRRFGEVHASVAQSYNNLALLLDARGARAEAEASFREAERVWRAALGEKHVTVAEALLGRGRLLCAAGRAAEGEPLLREAVALRSAALDSTSVALAAVRRELAICLIALSRLGEAERLLLAAIPRMEAQWGPNDAGTRRATGALHDLRRRRGAARSSNGRG
jgi:serine/threonine-protein kinase